MKNTANLLRGLPLIVVGLLMSLCNDDGNDNPSRITIAPGPNAQAEAQKAFIEVENGMEIFFESGTFEFTSQLSIDNKHNVRILGAGREKTILSFKDQSGSGEGLLVNQCTEVLLMDFTITDTQGDALKAKSCTDITFVRVGTVWSGEPRKENGAYGLYPVQCTNVFIDECYAYGASDAGIYVGQSTNAIVRNSVAQGNVSGIQVENTTNADVYKNEVFDNTGGISVFDLPGLTKYGSKTRVYDNHCYDNNRTNFAPAGNTVGNVPAGTGIMLLSTREVEVFDNEIKDNMFGGIIMASYLMLGQPADPNYNPLYGNIYVHDNNYSRNGIFNTNQTELAGKIAYLINAFGFAQPDILIDNLTSGGVCISESPAVTFVNLHAESLTNETANLDNNIEPFMCDGTRLSGVEFDVFGLDEE